MMLCRDKHYWNFQVFYQLILRYSLIEWLFCAFNHRDNVDAYSCFPGDSDSVGLWRVPDICMLKHIPCDCFDQFGGYNFDVMTSIQHTLTS